MPIERVTRPYEALFRWSEGSKLTGAHVQFITELVEDGTVISATVGDALPVDVGAGAGFPVSQIMDAVHAGAVETADAAVADAAAARQEVIDAVAEKATAEGELARAVGAIRGMEEMSAQREERFRAHAEQLQREIKTQGERAMALQQEVERLTVLLESIKAADLAAPAAG